jgi:ABC transporter substrate binding protein
MSIPGSLISSKNDCSSNHPPRRDRITLKRTSRLGAQVVRINACCIITKFARCPSGGLIVTLEAFTAVLRDAIISQAAAGPSVYPLEHCAIAGGLISYGVDASDLHHRAASYVDRIIRGESLAGLPIQQPTKFNLVINLKTAHAVGVTVMPEGGTAEWKSRRCGPVNVPMVALPASSSDDSQKSDQKRIALRPLARKVVMKVMRILQGFFRIARTFI